ncbi:hypothetical protein [Okeania sp. SIO2B3]|uniref:hypothetical protein n=1 Tax=Okeania sp. SIO2B3 TaxID=2607784 RepID=UPI0013C1AE6B|nr:hypothetical protein [Okeania sp. SIO2B3]NET42023.1 hypothetical protein [Okeania sp. SIO2B3]
MKKQIFKNSIAESTLLKLSQIDLVEIPNQIEVCVMKKQIFKNSIAESTLLKLSQIDLVEIPNQIEPKIYDLPPSLMLPFP